MLKKVEFSVEIIGSSLILPGLNFGPVGCESFTQNFVFIASIFSSDKKMNDFLFSFSPLRFLAVYPLRSKIGPLHYSGRLGIDDLKGMLLLPM